MQRNFIFDGGSSTRYHTCSVLERQTIADHSFGVAWLCELFTEGRASKALILAALAHDLAEHVVGDVPSPAKRALGISGLYQRHEDDLLDRAGIGRYAESLGTEELTTLKFADMVEGMIFCVKERRFGNRHVEVVYGRFKSYVDELLKVHGYPDTLVIASYAEEINNEWKELTYDSRAVSERTASGRGTLQGAPSTLGLGEQDGAHVSARAGDKVSDSLEEEEWGPGFRERAPLPG